MILIGDSGVGKSSLLTRYSRNEFSNETKTTIGVEFASILVNIDHKHIKVTIWDTAGQERFRAATSAYYRNTLGAFVVYDITNRSTFLNVTKWIEELKEHAENEVCMTLVGNKCDLRHLRAISKDEAMDFADAHNMNFMETSALDSVNIESTFKEIITEIYKKVEAEIEEASNNEDSYKTINVTLKPDGESKLACCNTN